MGGMSPAIALQYKRPRSLGLLANDVECGEYKTTPVRALNCIIVRYKICFGTISDRWPTHAASAEEPDWLIVYRKIGARGFQ